MAELGIFGQRTSPSQCAKRLQDIETEVDSVIGRVRANDGFPPIPRVLRVRFRLVQRFGTAVKGPAVSVCPGEPQVTNPSRCYGKARGLAGGVPEDSEPHRSAFEMVGIRRAQ